MPALRKCLSHPGTYLGLVLVLAAAVCADGLRPAKAQLCVRAYVGAVHAYQELISPHLEGHVRCRYYPTCSRYSVEAVEKYGIRRGLVLTAERISRCRQNVSLGSVDPVP